MSDPEFDFVIVGRAPAAGRSPRVWQKRDEKCCPGGRGRGQPFNYEVPVFHGLATEDKEMRLDHYVRHYADEVRQAQDPKYQVELEAGRHGVYYPRARTLGGCTAHYAMIIIRPHESDWRAIQEATGDASWAPQNMNGYFETVERWQYSAGSKAGHGHDGWLPTRFTDLIDLTRQRSYIATSRSGRSPPKPRVQPGAPSDQFLTSPFPSKSASERGLTEDLESQRHGVGLIAVLRRSTTRASSRNARAHHAASPAASNGSHSLHVMNDLRR